MTERAARLGLSRSRGLAGNDGRARVRASCAELPEQPARPSPSARASAWKRVLALVKPAAVATQAGRPSGLLVTIVVATSCGRSSARRCTPIMIDAIRNPPCRGGASTSTLVAWLSFGPSWWWSSAESLDVRLLMRQAARAPHDRVPCNRAYVSVPVVTFFPVLLDGWIHVVRRPQNAAP